MLQNLIHIRFYRKQVLFYHIWKVPFLNMTKVCYKILLTNVLGFYFMRQKYAKIIRIIIFLWLSFLPGIWLFLGLGFFCFPGGKKICFSMWGVFVTYMSYSPTKCLNSLALSSNFVGRFLIWPESVGRHFPTKSKPSYKTYKKPTKNLQPKPQNQNPNPLYINIL